ncbi:ubiquitin binding protein [Coprinopsis marcescibilis]|uniref:Vacuolar protein sorting-associated protein 27 n=1 Tax=Coprinopsis marcescibilis TaxID=230819 RepID=A0A5C3L5R6_COPMA|nr:ubiquitin binding protein [Coprinopsis marcescibilis]
MSITSWIWGTSQLDDAIDKATSEMLPAGSEDIALNLEICDQIRSKSAPAKDAMKALKRRLNHKNPNVQLLALSLTDVCVKNGGDLFLNEVASREFMDNLVSILKIPALNLEVKNMILRLVQNWSIAFEGKPALSYVGQVYKSLLSEGYKFPPKDLVVANAAMVDTQTAPEWIDSDVCLRCRTTFTFTNRKHHCRNCGQVFDQGCSSKSMALPHFGIAQEVRVCDGCFNKLTKKGDRLKRDPKDQAQQSQYQQHSKASSGHKYSSSSSKNRTNGQDLEDAELQRAIQLSLQEASGSKSGYVPSQPSPTKWHVSEPPIVDRMGYAGRDKLAAVDEEDDPDLRAAIEASLMEASAPKPSAPAVDEGARYEQQRQQQEHERYLARPSVPALPNHDLDPLEEDAILTFNQTVEQVEAQGGRDLSKYPAVTSLYDKASSLRPKLAVSLDDTTRKQELLSDMNSKLSEAVKLYDQILTHQVSQPRYRTLASPAPYQPSTNAYHTAGYASNQWAASTPTPAPVGQNMVPSSPQAQFYPQQQTQYAPLAPPAMAPVQHFEQQLPNAAWDQNGRERAVASPPPPPPQVGLARQQTGLYTPAPVQPVEPTVFAPDLTAAPSIDTRRREWARTQGELEQYEDAERQKQHDALERQRQYEAGVAAERQRQYEAAEQARQQHLQQLRQDQVRQSLLVNAPSPPTSLPYMPSVPTTALPSFGNGVEREERKEALLIDL